MFRIIDDVMKNIMRKIILLGNLFCIGYTAVSIYSSIADKTIKKKLESHIIKNLPAVIEAQEKKLGIKHIGVPRIMVSYSDFPNGGYDAEEDSLEIMIESPEAIDDTSTKEILDHELGHFYVDKMEEKMGKRLHYNDSESIARYFGNTMNDIGDSKDMQDKNLKEYRIIRPLIKKYGVKGAIEHLLISREK